MSEINWKRRFRRFLARYNIPLPAYFEKKRPVTVRVIRNARKKGVTFYSRRQWGSKYPALYRERRKVKPHFLLPGKPVDTIIKHISVTLDHGPLSHQFHSDMQTIELIGFQRFKSGVSYNIVIDMQTGEAGLGQDLDVKGTHTVNEKNVPNFSYDQNGVALGICFMGMPGDRLTKAAVDTWIKIEAALVEEGAATETYDSVPHSLFAYKDCPTDAVRNLIPKVKLRALTMAKGA